MKVKVLEVEVVVEDLVSEVEGRKVIDFEALKRRLEEVGVKVAILPDGPPDPGRQ